MPDANGNFRGVSVPAEAWERVFGLKQRLAERHEREKPLYRTLGGHSCCGRIKHESHSTIAYCDGCGRDL